MEKLGNMDHLLVESAPSGSLAFATKNVLECINVDYLGKKSTVLEQKKY